MVSQLEIFGLALDGAADAANSETMPARDGIARALNAVRRHLGMEIAFISEFGKDDRIFHYVSSTSPDAPIKAGQRLSLDRGYCRKVVDGEIPQLIPDTNEIPILNLIPETKLLPIGSHMSVPIRMTDGSVYGTLCCLSSHANPSLNERDLRVLRAVAELVSLQIADDVTQEMRRRNMEDMVRAAIAAGEPNIVYQPIFELGSNRMVGAEALSRFSQVPYRTPDKWFADAGIAGLRADLELIAIENAVKAYKKVWAYNPELYLAINASAVTLLERDVLSALKAAPLDRIVIEITEHEQIDDYHLLQKALAPLRSQEVRIAVDDAGSGYASLRHILQLRPEVVKLDISLTREIDGDPMRRMLTAAVVGFGQQTGCKIVAEGIETSAELAAISQIGVEFGQGFLLGKPGPADAMMESVEA